MKCRLIARGRVVALVSTLALVAACNEKDNNPTPRTVSSLAVSASRPSLARGTTVQLSAKAIYSDNTTEDVTYEAIWSSSADSRLAVTVSGTQCQARGLAAGTGRVTAAFSGKSGSVDLEVTPAQLESLSVAPDAVSLAKGTTHALAVTGRFSDDTTPDLTADAAWSSADPAVAAVVNGVVEARGLGSTTVQAVVQGKTAEASVIVTAAEVKDLALDQAPFRIIVAQSKQLSVTGFFTDGTALNINSQIDWSSDNAAVATVAKDGTVTAKAAGQANITAARGTLAKSLAVTVVAPTLIAVEIEGTSAQLPKGLTTQLSAVAKYDNLQKAIVNGDAAWTASSGIASVSASGLVTASKTLTGKVRIIATYGGFGGVYDLEVTPAVVSKIDVDPGVFTMPAGLKKQLAATATFSDETTKLVTADVAWSTSESSLCTISNAAAAKGLLSALKPGACTATATLSGVSGAATITVSDAALTNVTITPLQSELKRLPIGLTQQFTATGTYTDGSNLDITKQVVWTSSNDVAASISNASFDRGLASAILPGVTIIKAEDPETHLRNGVVLTTVPAVIVKLDVSCDKTTVPLGLETECKATGTYSIPGMQLPVTSFVTWGSAKPAVATISNVAPNNGHVTAKALGKTTMCAEDPATKTKACLDLTVTDALLLDLHVTQVPLYEYISRSSKSGSAPPAYPVEFKAIGHYSDNQGVAVDLTSSANWSVDANCSSSANVIRGKLPGGFVCTVTAALNGLSESAKLDILDAILNAMVVEPTPVSAAKGTSVDFKAWGVYGYPKPQMGFEFTKLVTWLTRDVSGTSPVAEVSNAPGSQGKAFAKNLGKALVQAIDPESKVSGEALLNVTPAVLTSIGISPKESSIHRGQHQCYEVTGTFSDDTRQDMTSGAGLSALGAMTGPGDTCFTGTTPGEATITATYGEFEDTAKLVVSAAQLLAIEIHTFESLDLFVGQNARLLAYGYYTDTDTLKGGKWDNMTPFVAWDSSAALVAQVSNDLRFIGSVTGLAVGKATITAVDPATLVYGTATVTVVPAP